MKINILNDNPKGLLSGYKNVDPFADGSDKRIQCSLQLEIFDPCEADEIRCMNILRHISYDEAKAFLSNLKDKLGEGCKLSIGDLDISILIKEFIRQDLQVPEFNTTIKNVDYLYNMESCCGLLKAAGLKIQRKYFEGNSFIIEAIK